MNEKNQKEDNKKVYNKPKNERKDKELSKVIEELNKKTPTTKSYLNSTTSFLAENKMVILIYIIFIIFIYVFDPFGLTTKHKELSIALTVFSTLFVISISFYNYNNSTKSFLAKYNYLVVFFIYIIFLFFLYVVDPFGLTSKYANKTIIYLIIFSMLMFVLLLAFGLTNKIDSIKGLNFDKNHIRLSHFMLMVVYITFLILLNGIDPYGIISKDQGLTIALTVILTSLFAVILTYYTSDTEVASKGWDQVIRASYIILGLLISGLFMYWIITGIGNLSSSSSIISLIINILLILVILVIIYKFLEKNKFFQDSTTGSSSPAILRYIVNLILYIPCLFSGIFDMFFFSSNINLNEEAKQLRLLGMVVLLFVAYFILPYIEKFIMLQGGKQLLNDPVYLDTKRDLSNYQELNGTDRFDYQYGISFWTYIDEKGVDTSSTYNHYTSILNYGNKPGVLYDGKTNSLIVVVDQKDFDKKSKNDTLEYDNNGYRIIYKRENLELQKWNNIIINYNGGTLDIFFNGELVRSAVCVVPYMTYDNLSVGQDNGLNGGMCNVIYFKKPLSMSQIYYLYHLVKNKTPPTLYGSSI